MYDDYDNTKAFKQKILVKTVICIQYQTPSLDNAKRTKNRMS